MAGNIAAPRFTIGRTLGDSINIFGRNIVAFVLAALAIRLLLLLAPPNGQAVAVMTGAAQINWFNAIASMVPDRRHMRDQGDGGVPDHAEPARS